jgi:hypothetical protein
VKKGPQLEAPFFIPACGRRIREENTVAGYRVEARSRAVSKSVEALPIPPTASVLVVIRDGVARGAASAPAACPTETMCWRSHARKTSPCSIACLDRAPSEIVPRNAVFSASSPLMERPAQALQGDRGAEHGRPRSRRRGNRHRLADLSRLGQFERRMWLTSLDRALGGLHSRNNGAAI